MRLLLVGVQLQGEFQSARLKIEILSQNKGGGAVSGVLFWRAQHPKYHRNQVWRASGSVQDHSELQSKTMTQKAERGFGPQLSRWNVLPPQGEPGSSTQETRLCGQQ